MVRKFEPNIIALTETHKWRYIIRGYNSIANLGDLHSGGVQILSKNMTGGQRKRDLDSKWTIAIEYEEALII